MQQILDYFIANRVETLGTIASLIYLFLSIKQNIWCWSFGIISAIAYIIVFFTAKFYATMGLQFYYVGISIYGWYFWLHGNKSNGTKDLPVVRLSKKLSYILLLISICLFIVIAFVLNNFTDSPIPYWDAFTTSLSIIATWMIAKKILEHWIIWVVVDIVSIGLYINQALNITVFLFVVYTIMAVVGFIQWKKSLLDPIQK